MLVHKLQNGKIWLNFFPSLGKDCSCCQLKEHLLEGKREYDLYSILQADIEKKSAEEAIQRAEEDKRLQIEQEKLAAEQAQRDYEQDIEEKLLKLPEEPASNVEGAITVMIRTPKGARFGRR